MPEMCLYLLFLSDNCLAPDVPDTKTTTSADLNASNSPKLLLPLLNRPTLNLTIE